MGIGVNSMHLALRVLCTPTKFQHYRSSKGEVRMLGTSKLKRGGFLARQFSQSLLQQHYNFKPYYTFNPYDTTITRHIYRSFMALSQNWFSRSQYKFKFKIVKSEPSLDGPSRNYGEPLRAPQGASA